jgi:hypothetical protein
VRAAAPVLLVAAIACRLPAQPRPTAEEGDWAAARERFTRAGKLYDGLAANAFIRAVYLPRAVREARVARVATWKVLSVEETEKLLATERDEAANFEDFQIDLFTPVPADNDLDASKSVWRIALVVPGAPDRLPLAVEQVRPDAMLRTLYPGIGDFDVVYHVRFQRTEPLEGKSFVLRLAGAKGRLDLQY